jgi:hypothetical protein
MKGPATESFDTACSVFSMTTARKQIVAEAVALKPGTRPPTMEERVDLMCVRKVFCRRTRMTGSLSGGKSDDDGGACGEGDKDEGGTGVRRDDEGTGLRRDDDGTGVRRDDDGTGVRRDDGGTGVR